MPDLEALRYPIGRYTAPDPITEAHVDAWIDQLARLPGELREAVDGLDDAQLDTPYRPGGWTPRQVVHHIGDSHLNSLIRFKWALTEETPTIKAYDEQRWAELPDYQAVPIAVSLNLIEALHHRLVALLRSMDAGQRKRAFIHPEGNHRVVLDWNIGQYAWHGRHHVAHITHLRERNGWQ